MWELRNNFIFISGKPNQQYSLSPVGISCRNPVNNSLSCTSAGNEANLYDQPSGDHSGNGTDLPFGCISARTTSGAHSIFWNPNGMAISDDPKVRQICVDQDKPFEGISIRYFYMIFER